MGALADLDALMHGTQTFIFVQPIGLNEGKKTLGDFPHQNTAPVSARSLWVQALMGL